MNKLKRDDLMSLETYSKNRAEFRAKVIAHKKNRAVPIGAHATLYFEDSLTIQYQIQEMLRVEKIFEEEGILDELNAYNPLIPDGKNLKATFMIEYDDVEERRIALGKLSNIEDKVWLRVGGFGKVFAIADEDMERSTETKTSAVHFMRFEFSDQLIKALKDGAEFGAGIDHPHYTESVFPLPENIRSALLKDFD